MTSISRLVRSISVLAVVLAVTFAAPNSALSQTISSCYSKAETDNTGLSLTLEATGVTAVDTSSLSTVAQFVAEHWDDSLLSVTANAAGEQAVDDAIECLLDAGIVTLSALRLNEMSAFSVRSATFYKGSVNHTLHAVLDGPGSNKWIQFAAAGCHSSAVEAESEGSHDFKIDAVGGASVDCLPNGGTCPDGICMGESDPETGALSCDCSAGDQCVTVVGVIDVGDHAMIIHE